MTSDIYNRRINPLLLGVLTSISITWTFEARPQKGKTSFEGKTPSGILVIFFFFNSPNILRNNTPKMGKTGEFFLG